VREFTGAGGEFTVDGMAPGLYAVFVPGDGPRGVERAPCDAERGESPAEVEAALERAGERPGYVRDAATQRPLAARSS
jgi:hypothetical protein